MVTKLAVAICVGLLATVTLAAAERSRESFNQDWRFARFGPMPDRTTLPEPGGETWSIAATASSEAADRPKIKADGADLAFITVTVADKDGLLVPRTHNLVTFKVEGPGEIVAVGNGDAASHEPYQARQRKAYNGLCLAIVRAKAGEAGTIKLKAASAGLAGSEILIGAGGQ